ncbi:hypothetical protein BBI01_18540 [Chryseobacterium artocarpi]|uniref:Uncharacterized protein n=1 Tax=Chryseobacterium artocarpi TaxID=1414727 RepID=A0A1B8Z9Z9_9FLAO|nr:pinensin family lanthipeptide [Chryseobacterium artocarpi]OCA68443.1 hypothetical protein BBI01_18540 [Chryseobacterium artocarpi]
MNKKLTLEDLKLESFLTEIDNSKLVKVQGGNGAYGGETEDSCGIYCDDLETMGVCGDTDGSDNPVCNTCNETDGCTEGDGCPGPDQ